MKPASKLLPLSAAALFVAMGLAGCGGGEDLEDDDGIDYSPWCNESRGAVYRHQMIVEGKERINVSDLGTWPFHRLAEERKPGPEILGHIEAWDQSIQTNRDALRAIPPVFSEGRVIEPDTTTIDQQMMRSIEPHAAALKAWVSKECGDV